MAVNYLSEDPSGARRRTVLNNELTHPAATTPATTPTTTPLAGGIFSDPYTNLYERLATSQLGKLSQPFSDPNLDAVTKLIASRVSGLTSAAPVSFSASNPYAGEYADVVRQRIAELNQAPFSSTEEARMKTGVMNSIEATRTADRQRALEDIARRGIADSSGVLQERYRAADASAATNRTPAETDLAKYITDQTQQRKNQAVQFGGTLAQLGEGEAGRSLQGQIAAQSANQSRESQIMGAAGMLADIAAQRRGEQRARESDVLLIAQSLAQLTPQRLALAMSVLGGTSPDLNSIFGNTLNLSNTQTNANQTQSAQSSNMLLGLAQLMGWAAGQGKT